MDVKKNIAIYISGFYSGGIEEFVTNIAFALNREKYNIMVITRFSDVNSEAYGKLIRSNVQVYDMHINYLNVNTLVSVKRKISTILKKNPIDVIHINSLDEPVICTVAEKYNIKIALHVHEPQREQKNKLVNLIKDIIRKQNIRKADFFLACSLETGRTVYNKYGIDNFKIISNGIIYSKFKYDQSMRNHIRKMIGIKDEVVVGHVGRFTDVKNHEFIVDISSYLLTKNDYKVVFVGQGETYDKTVSKMSELGFQEKVVFLGERSDVCDILQAFDVFIMPSKFEGLGISLIEAQASGLKCVVSDRIPDEAIVTDLVTKLPINDNAEVWADVIRNIGLNSKREIYSEQVGNSRFNINYTCHQLEGIYG